MRTSLVRDFLLCALCSVASLVTLGCRGDAEPPRPEILQQIDSEPLAVFEPGGKTEAQAFAAIDQLAAACMKANGFPPPPVFSEAEYVNDEGVTSDTGGRYGLWVEPKGGTETGSEEPPRNSTPAESDVAETDVWAGFSSEWYLAYWGDSNDPSVWIYDDPSDPSLGSTQRGGCLGQAETAIYGDLHVYYPLLYGMSHAISDSFDSAMSDPRGRALLKRYSECMGEFGFTASFPGEAVGTALENGASLDAVYAAEHTCARRGEVIAQFEQLIWNYQQQWIDEHPTQVQEFISIWEDVPRRIATATGQAR